MYDKSKKTWSQRLKITKTEKTATTTTTTRTTALTAPSTPPAAAANNAHNFGRNQTPQYQAVNSVTAMHLPTLQLQQLHDYHNGGGGSEGGGGGGAYEYLPNALSRSMKYAEPWIYGTVRGIPARPYHHYVHQTARAAAPSYVHPHAAAIFAAHPLAGAGGAAEALAVVICSCPEYLNGTKREVKKASVCKKCKGSRLPLAPFGGTMRLPTAPAGGLKLRGSGAATVRVVSTSKKSRPTILDPKMDPYDLMRRTRLLSPEPGSVREESGSSKEKTRARGKSTSPARGRSRKRSQLAPPPPKKQSSSSGEADLPDCWLVEDAETLLNVSGNAMASPSTSARRSILRCSVNPYDLISIKSTQNNKNTNASSPTATTSTATRGKQLVPGNTSQNEFMPPNDDFNVEDAALTEEAPPFAVSGAGANGKSSRLNAANINHASALPKPPKIIAASRTRRDNRAASAERSKEATAAPAVQAVEEDALSKLNYTNVQAIAGQRISLGERRSGNKSLIKQSEDGRCYESIIIAGEDEQQAKDAAKDAKQNQLAKQSRPQQLHPAKAEEDRKRRAATTPPVESPPPPPPTPTRPASPEAAAAKQCQPKRPPRVRKEESAANADSDVDRADSAENADETESVTVLTVTPTQHIKSILKRPSSKSSECSDAASAADATEHQALSVGKVTPGEAFKSTATPTNQRRANSVSGSASSAASPTANSQFYIPLPQATRKKVQFMVEERVIHALDNSNDKLNELSDEEAYRQQPQQQQQPYNSADNERSQPLADERAEQEAAAEGHTRKSTANYEYYNRKRERQRLLRQQNAHKTTTTLTASDSPTGAERQAQTQAALLAELQHESDLVSHALNALNRKNNSNNNNNYSAYNSSNNAVDSDRHSSAGNRVYVDADDLVASAESAPQTHSETDPMHYEDVVAAAMTNAQQQRQQKQQLSVANSNSNNHRNGDRVGNKIKSDTSAKLLPTQCHAGGSPQSSSAPTVAATAIIAAISTTTKTAATLSPTSALPSTQTAAGSHVEASAEDVGDDDNDGDDDDDGDGDGDVDGASVNTDEDVAQDDNHDNDADDAAVAVDNVVKAKHATATATAATTAATTATTARIAVAPKANDYDDGVATLQAFVAGDSNARATQSRNPIRRSHSERQQPHNFNNNSSGNNGPAATHCKDRRRGSGNENAKNNANISSSSSSTNNNNRAAVLSFHDTTALRCRSNRNDSRDLFVRHATGGVTAASSGMSRPREPPPPPPPTPPPTLPTSAKAATTAAAAAAAATASECNAAAPTSKTHALSFSLQGQTAIAAADKGKHVVATQEKAATAQVAENSKVAGKALDKQLQHQQQHQQPRARTERVQTNAKQPAQLPHKGTSHQAPDSANLPNTATNKDVQQMAAAKPQQQRIEQHNNNGKESNGWETTMRAITTPHGNSLPTAASSAPSYASSSSFACHTPSPTAQQRTVVRVAPFNKTTSEVHRLKISHTDAEPTGHPQSPHHPHHHHRQSPTSPYSFQYSANGDATQKKTSILINGDDCYSTMNLSCDDASTPLYHSSVVVADYSASSTSAELLSGLKVTTTSNTVTINVSSPRSAQDELIYQHNKINTLRSRQAREHAGAVGGSGEAGGKGGGRAIIPIRGTPEVSLQRSASSTSSTSTSSMTSISSSGSGSGSGSIPKRGRTLIRLDYEKEKSMPQEQSANVAPKTETTTTTITTAMNQAEPPTILLSHEEELLKILRNPVEAVKRNLVPHVCGRNEASSDKESVRNKKMQETVNMSAALMLPTCIGGAEPKPVDTPLADAILRAPSKSPERNSSFIAKLLEDPMLSQVADGLENEIVAELIENSLKRLQESRSAIDMSGTKDSDDMNRLINLSLQKIKEERQNTSNSCNATNNNANANANANGSSCNTHLSVPTKDEDGHSNRGSISSANSFASANNYEMFDFDANESDCYQSCSSEITTPGDDDASSAATRSKFYQMLVDATLAEIEMSTNIEEDVDSHHYESIRNNGDPIYEEINDVPPPLPLTAPPISDPDMEKKSARSIFEGASKYDILSYLVDAKERGVVREEPFEYPLNCSNPIIIEEEACDTLSDLGKRKQKRDMSSRASILSDSSEDNQSIMSSLSPPPNNFLCGNSGGASLLQRKGASSDIERNDSGVGSETSKSSRSKYQTPLIASNAQLSKNSPIHLCEDCDGPVETQVTDSGIMFAPLVCRKCGKKRVERKEIITEVVETEEKYGRDLQIILEEFCHPMLVAGLLTQEQLSAIFLNTEELLENNQTLAERMRDALDIALEQGDDDLLTVNIGKIFLDFTQMLHAFESYCVRQAGASLLLANLEKEKELLRIFLKVSQMENAVLRRMNLNSFLMVPVQRVTKYPLLLARLYKVTPAHLEGRDQLKQAQEKIELHLNHINQEAKDVPTKLWRRISSSSPNRRASCEIDMINIKLRKMAIDILEWNHDEVRFAMEGKLLYTQPTDSNWKKARTIKLTPVNALLVTNGKPSANYKAEKVMSDKLNFPKHTGIREASLLVVKEKCGRYTLIREPLYLDRCVVCSEADWDDYFEVQEISSKDTFIFKAEDGVRTKQWYTQLQYHAQGMGAWRKRRNALANIMINGMLTRT